LQPFGGMAFRPDTLQHAVVSSFQASGGGYLTELQLMGIATEYSLLSPNFSSSCRRLGSLIPTVARRGFCGFWQLLFPLFPQPAFLLFDTIEEF
jgi:hypothetical protein